MTIPNFVINVGYDSGGDVLVKSDITSPNLRYSTDAYATAVYTGVNSGSGRYTFTNVVSGVYRLYDSTSAVAGLGDIYVGESNVVTLTTAQTGITGAKTFTGAVTLEKPTLGGGGVAIQISEDTSVLTGSKLEVADAPATATSVARKTETDAITTQLTNYYLYKGAGGSNQAVFPDTTFVNYLTSYKDPTNLLHVANRKFVESYCNAILSGLNPSAYQQSTNIIRVLYSGTQETNKVYTTLGAAITQAESFASSSRIMIVDIQGDGAGGEVANYNLLPLSVDSYVNIIQKPNSTIVAADDTYTADTLGLNIIQGGIIDNENASANTTFEKWVFIDVEFTNTDATGTYDFVNCQFFGDCRYSDCTITMDSNCVGELRNTTGNGKKIGKDLVYNDYQIVTTDGDIRGRRKLGTQASDIAAGTTLTLNNGNYAIVTGAGATITTITSTGWTDGSIIYLYFNGINTISTGVVNIDYIGGSFNTVAGTIYGFLYDQSSWIRIS